MDKYIKIDSKYPVYNGMPLTFVAPCNCNETEGLSVNGQSFVFKDAHGHTLTGIGNLFGEGAYVKVILDADRGFAYIQNADSNGYLENRLVCGLGLEPDALALVSADTIDDTTKCGWYRYYNDSLVPLAGLGYCGGLFVGSTYSESIQHFYPDNYNGGTYAVRRRSAGGIWSEWEIANPPYDNDYIFEYKTTERYMGYPVYTRIVLGEIDSDIECPVGYNLYYDIGSGCSLIRGEARLSGLGCTLPYYWGDMTDIDGYTFYNDRLQIFGSSTLAGQAISARIWYVKEAL